MYITKQDTTVEAWRLYQMSISTKKADGCENRERESKLMDVANRRARLYWLSVAL